MKQRDCSIDIAKGLLIIGVVYYHMWTILTGSCQIEHPAFRTMYNVHNGYTVFFMPAFFVITGYCSNFTRSFKQFIISNVRTILVPMIMLNLIPCLLSFNAEALRYMLDVDKWLWGLSFWFLPALFLAKLFFWPIAHFVADYKFSWLLASLCFILAELAEIYSIGINYWYWKSALAFVLFLQIGYWLRHSKHKNLVLRSGAILYIIAFPICFYILGYHLPMIGLTVIGQWKEILPFLITSISGCLGIMYISKLINKCIILEYIGKSSLVIYCSHWFIAQHLCKYLSKVFIMDSNIKAATFYLVSVIMAVGFSCFLYRIYDTKYLRWIIGKK